MSHYRSNLRDITFNLFEVFGRDRLLGTGPWEDVDIATARDMLAAGAELAETDLAESFADSALGTIDFDPATGTARLPEAFAKSYASYVAAEWWRMDVSPEIGGIAAPPSLRWAMSEFPLGANPAIFLYAAGWPQAEILYHQGNADQKRLAELMSERHWGATMVLTEPDAGSAVGSGKTKAVPQPDGTWHLHGVKRFITSAEHDLAENIVHFVLARPTDTPGAGGPGTKGLSLFVVPKHHVDLETGEIGARNGAVVTNVEKKMGLKASLTCELTFGDADTPAVGWLVGDVHDGIAQMFEVVEYARMLVGTKAVATLSTGYLNALDYAQLRRQGADLARRGDRSAPDVPIIDHPDVRRSLMTQKYYAEGMRALVSLAACTLDDIALAEHTGEDASAARTRNDLLLPIVKGFCSEKAYALLSESLQVFGGSGYLHDYPVEQYIRDAKIDTIYEGTTTIQGIDFFFRKIRRDRGAGFGLLLGELEDEATELRDGSTPLAGVGEALLEGLRSVRSVVATLDHAADEAQDEPTRLYDVGTHTTRLLLMTGELVVGWMLAKQARVALERLDETPEDGFYLGKVAGARQFAAEQLPHLSVQADLVERADAVDLMALPVSAF
ncbi:butyryl-CoA dehydrogenase [Aeromicrobium sp. Root495]|uniref:acyl-CoA dehydrogenase n=1 Tax=Aeromicrobium sp. Root495 TaxID=1736550 RepID=UPI0006FCF0B5|nr:acyl-CoA dehydrogenase [Aeromicrobium sp. Root495]KQY56147.1 butyryl-CoA dehydrogenase [Aeromicrobium sp. Root495]